MKMNKIKKTLGILLMTCVLLFASITQSEAATATMTQAERKVYTKWLLNGITKTQYGTYYKSKTQLNSSVFSTNIILPFLPTPNVSMPSSPPCP